MQYTHTRTVEFQEQSSIVPKKSALIIGGSVGIFVVSTIALWNLNHGFMAFLNVMSAGIFVLSGLTTVGSNQRGGLTAMIIAALISIMFISLNSTDPIAEEKAKKAAEVAAEQARLDAMTPEQRDTEQKKKAFESTRAMYGYLLTNSIKEGAYDPDAMKIKSPEYYNNGVCVKANGKNRFGAYVGWKEYCYLIDNKGKWSYSGPN